MIVVWRNRVRFFLDPTCGGIRWWIVVWLLIVDVVVGMWSCIWIRWWRTTIPPLDYIPGCSRDLVVGRRKAVGTVVGMRMDLMELVELELVELELELMPVVL